MKPTLRADRYAVLTAQTTCYSCKRSIEVSALLVPAYMERHEDSEWETVDGSALLIYVEAVDEAVRSTLVARAPQMQQVASKTAGLTYWANLCTCGAMQGDWYLHEPEGPFFPQDSDGITAISVEWVEAPLEARASASQSSWTDRLVNAGHGAL